MLRSLLLPFPPSVNHYWRHFVRGRRAIVYVSKEGNDYRKKVADVTNVGQPLDGLLRIEASVWMPDKRKRDLDNISKSLLDALTKACIWHDDWQVRDMRLREVGILKGGLIQLHIYSFTYDPYASPINPIREITNTTSQMASVHSLSLMRAHNAKSFAERARSGFTRRRVADRRGAGQSGRRNRRTVHWSFW